MSDDSEINFKFDFIGYFWLSFFVPLFSGFLVWSYFFKNAIFQSLALTVLIGVVFLILAVFKIRLAFWFFIASLPLENIFLKVPMINLRLFQLFALILMMALIISFFKRLFFQAKQLSDGLNLFDLKGSGEGLKARVPLFKKNINRFDFLILFLPALAFFGYLNSAGASLKLVFILVSFVALYFLMRVFFVCLKDFFELLGVFILGSFIPVAFSFYQVLAIKIGLPNFTTFSLRPNGTFFEPDWLGGYLVFVLSLVLFLKWLLNKSKMSLKIGKFSVKKIFAFFLNGYFFVLFGLLFLTVCRSAWLAFAVLIFVYFLVASLTCLKDKLFFKNFFKEFLMLFFLIFLAIAGTDYFNLSSFHLINRAASSFDGKQLITISCGEKNDNSILPQSISDVSELAKFDCRHINLEEISNEKKNGNQILEIYRNDPSVGARKMIYTKITKSIFNNPRNLFFGQGLGASGKILGQDNQGISYNSANIFLESWVSLGLGGFLVFILIFFWPLIFCLRGFYFNLKTSFSLKNKKRQPKDGLIAEDFSDRLIFEKETKKRQESFMKEVFIVFTLLPLLIFNLFNAGIFLGFFWGYLGILSFWFGKKLNQAESDNSAT